MVGPRHAAAAALTGLVLSLLASSCVAVVGADEDRIDAVNVLCLCLQQQYSDVFRYREQCTAAVGQRLDAATDDTRRTWLEAFRDMDCDTCRSVNILACYRTEPTCSKEADACADDRECCSGLTCGSLPGEPNKTCLKEK